MTTRRIAFALRLFLGGLLVYASHDKLFDPQPFANAVDNYQILPYSLVNMAAIALPWIEMVTGLCLIAGVFAPGAGLVATGMFAVFTVALVIAVLRGLNINCGCFSLEEGAEKVSWLAASGRAVLTAAGVFVTLSSLQTDWPAAWLKKPRREKE